MESPQEQQASSDILQKEIQAQSEKEAGAILEQAQREAQQILNNARKEADGIKADMIKKAETQAESIRRKILSGVRLDVKKQNLRTREELLSKIFEQVKEKIEAFRQTEAYKDYLKELVIEGATAIDAERMRVLSGTTEKKLLSEATVKQIIGEIQKRTGRKTKLSIADQALPEGGVVMVSDDERMLFDNRFSARMQRMQSQMRLEAMKRVMG